MAILDLKKCGGGGGNLGAKIIVGEPSWER